MAAAKWRKWRRRKIKESGEMKNNENENESISAIWLKWRNGGIEIMKASINGGIEMAKIINKRKKISENNNSQ